MSQEGKKIYVETLMSPEEWKERTKTYKSSNVEKYPEFFDSEVKWRWRMGQSLLPEEIKRTNIRLDDLYKLIKK